MIINGFDIKLLGKPMFNQPNKIWVYTFTVSHDRGSVRVEVGAADTTPETDRRDEAVENLKMWVDELNSAVNKY